MASLCQKAPGGDCDARPCTSKSCVCKDANARCSGCDAGPLDIPLDVSQALSANRTAAAKELPSTLPGNVLACCADCLRATRDSKRRPIVETRSIKQAAIQRTRTPDESLRVLEAAGIDPATLRPTGKAAAALNQATYTAIAEVMLGRLAWDPALRAWRIVAAESGVAVLNPGMPMRPAFEATRDGHLDTMMWLLMGGSYATITTQGR